MATSIATMNRNDVTITDPEMAALIKAEKQRQRRTLELTASENYTSQACLQALGSCLNNKYSEGQVGQRHYSGNEYIDKIESLTQARALEAFNLSSEEWGVNVQALSGTPANMAVFTALLPPHARIMGLHLFDGGHPSHGYMTPEHRLTATSVYFETMAYHIDPISGLIDYDRLAQNARSFQPKMIIAGISSYPRDLDYARFREICDETGAYLMADMAHVSGLVAAGVAPSPFLHCDVVTTTTHKSLRGPRAALIFYRKGSRKLGKQGECVKWDLEKKVNDAVFPGHQGGPHNHAIAGVGVALREACQPEFRRYQQQVIRNAQALSQALIQYGYTIITGGTDNHMVLVDLRPIGVDGARAMQLFESAQIAVNKIPIAGDDRGHFGGLRLGTPPLTTRGLDENDFRVVAELVHRGIVLTREIQNVLGSSLVGFKSKLTTDESIRIKVETFRTEVEEFVEKFLLPGYEDW